MYNIVRLYGDFGFCSEGSGSHRGAMGAFGQKQSTSPPRAGLGIRRTPGPIPSSPSLSLHTSTNGEAAPLLFMAFVLS